MHNALSQLASNPNDQGIQTAYASAFNDLKTGWDKMVASFEPAQIDLFGEIGADYYFVHDFPEDIRLSMQKNAATPAVAQQEMQELLTERQTYIAEITQLSEGLGKLGIGAIELEEGTAEIGFLIPRDLFNNQLDLFIEQLKVLRRIMRAFSESTTGSVEPIEVRQISSSDPLLFFGFSPLTIAKIAGAVTWALHTWKQVLEIRKIRADMEKTNAFSEDEVESFFGPKIAEIVDKQIESKVTELVSPADAPAGRKHEQRIDIHWALEQLLALVERGLKVEIHTLPPPPQEGGDEDQEAAIPGEFKLLEEIKLQLVFPRTEGTPVLDLPPPEPPKSEKKSPRKKGSD